MLKDNRLFETRFGSGKFEVARYRQTSGKAGNEWDESLPVSTSSNHSGRHTERCTGKESLKVGNKRQTV